MNSFKKWKKMRKIWKNSFGFRTKKKVSALKPILKLDRSLGSQFRNGIFFLTLRKSFFHKLYFEPEFPLVGSSKTISTSREFRHTFNTATAKSRHFCWVSSKSFLNSGSLQRYTYRVLQTIQVKLILLLCVWADRAVLGSAKSALKYKHEI